MYVHLSSAFYFFFYKSKTIYQTKLISIKPKDTLWIYDTGLAYASRSLHSVISKVTRIHIITDKSYDEYGVLYHNDDDGNNNKIIIMYR